MVKKSQIKKSISISFETVILIIIGLFSLLFTIYIILNAYEQVFFQDIRYLQTLRRFRNNFVLELIEQKIFTAGSDVSLHEITKDNFRYISFPSINSSIEVTASLKKGDQYYIRGNKAHVIRRENSNDTLVYFDEKWRTTLSMDELDINSLIFLSSNDVNYLFKISNIAIKTDEFKTDSEENLVPKLFIVCENSNRVKIITAELVNATRK
ncbi:hypothetical protein IT417_02160 [bacterium]|nr:hypothetical protein [bacterium]